MPWGGTAFVDDDTIEEGNWFADVGHGVLDVAGLVPLIGEPADGVNAAWYAAEGDYVNAGLSGAAMVPIGGWVASGGKFALRGADALRAGEAAARPASSAVSGRDLGRSLASEAQVAGPGRAIIGAGTRTRLVEAERLVREYGGNPQDWAKMTSPSHMGPDGHRFETHWYENLVTGERFEFKTKRF